MIDLEELIDDFIEVGHYT